MSTDNRALWVEDSDVLHCRNCKAVFSLFRRKHHCRMCGQIFCSSCIVNLNPPSSFWWSSNSNRGTDGPPSSLGKLCIHCNARQVEQQQEQRARPSFTDARAAMRWGGADTRAGTGGRENGAPGHTPIYHSPLSAGKTALPVTAAAATTAAPPPPRLESADIAQPACRTTTPEPMPPTTTSPRSVKSDVGRETPPVPPPWHQDVLVSLVPLDKGCSSFHEDKDNNSNSVDNSSADSLVWGLEDPPVKIKYTLPSRTIRRDATAAVAAAHAKPFLSESEALPFASMRRRRDDTAAPVVYQFYKKEQAKAALLLPTTFVRNHYATDMDEKGLRGIWEHVSALASAARGAGFPARGPLSSPATATPHEWGPNLLSSAWEAVGETVVPIGRFPQEHIMVLWEHGGAQPPRSDVVDGFVLPQLLLSRRMRTHLYNPKVLLVAGDLSYYSAAAEGASSVRVLNGYKGYLNSIWHRIQRWAPDLLLVEGDMHHYLQSTIIEQGHMSVVTNVGATMMRRIAAAAEATIMRDLDYANEADLLRTDIMGAVKEFKQVRVGDGTLRTILRGFAVPLYSTIVLQGPSANDGDEGDGVRCLVRAQLATVVMLHHLTLLAHVQMDFGIGMWLTTAAWGKTRPVAARVWQSAFTYNGDLVDLGAEPAAAVDSSSMDDDDDEGGSNSATSVVNCLTLRKVRLELGGQVATFSAGAEEADLNRRTYYTEHVTDTYTFYEGEKDTALLSFLLQAVRAEHVHLLYAHGHTKIQLTKRVCGAGERGKAYYCKGGPDAVECFSRAWRHGRYGPQQPWSAQRSKPSMSSPFCYAGCSRCEERRRGGETLTVALCSPFTLNMSMGAFLEYLCYGTNVTKCPMCAGDLSSSLSSFSGEGGEGDSQLGCAGLTFCFILFPSSEAFARVEVRFHVTGLQCCAVHYPLAAGTSPPAAAESNGEAGQEEVVSGPAPSLADEQDTGDCYVTAEMNRIYPSEPTSVIRAALLVEAEKKGASPAVSVEERLSRFMAGMPTGAAGNGGCSTRTYTLRATPRRTQRVREIVYTVDVLFGEAFFGLRQLLSGDPHDKGLLVSLARCTVFRAEGGKASADFYCSHDRKLLLKLVKSAELHHITSMGPAYFRYLAQRLSATLGGEGESDHAATTALVPLLGLYVVKASLVQTDGSTVHHEPRHYLLMENIKSKLPPAHLVDQVYDLKGSQRNRIAPKGSHVRLDVDFVYETQKGNFLFCTTAAKMHAISTLRADSRLLQSCTVTDYSLCVMLATCARARENGRAVSESEPERHIWLGIIDYLHPYNGAKRIESRVKSGIDTVLGGSVHDPTIIDPLRYQQRFLKWMHNYFCSVPGRFESETYVAQVDSKLHALVFEG